ncbi:uncharacterized protein [Watersipora subatra]|uniref:uncharacterized protein isoform X2 n=1 Tax=Watersipora subatra TaxID=2589382 RepID=UPI00355C19B4
MQFEDGRWRIREEQLHNSYSTTEDAPENLVISSEIKYKPCSVSPNICRVYRVDNLYGIRQFIQIPWWFTNARIHSVHPLDQGTLLYIMGRDVVKGEDMVIIWSTIRDRYGLPSIVTKEQLIRYMCDANWFIQYASAMYYTNFPGQGLQLYTVVPSDYIRDVRYDSAHLLYEFDLLRNSCKCSHEMVSSHLSPIVHRQLYIFIGFFEDRLTVRSMKQTIRENGISMIWRLFLLQELHMPVVVPSLKRTCLLAIALCLNNKDSVQQLPLPSSIKPEIMELCQNIL